MWAQRVVRLFAPHTARCRRSRACCTVYPGVRLISSHTGVSPRSFVTCSQPAPLPGMRACLLPGISAYSTHTLDPDSSWEEGAEEKMIDEPLPEFNINILVKVLQQENGKDLCVIRVPPEVKYVEYFVIVGGTSSRHLQAMAQYTLKMYKYLKERNKSQLCIEGKDTDDWMCIDFGTIVVHFMLAETRETYELEKLWTLRSYDDQLSQMVQEILPTDFIFGLQQHKM
ncbi:mitochondrial assembly of ribosomal large subunit protein 1 [Mixophyes fleayi]|uniref:mitochondrial assembly of ribosomal large subunit protein 1 n=1 Tax=Mixophyes fleayi TaxID=3061075 RepID=UPI003F4DB174